jgi:hypothetical protein
VFVTYDHRLLDAADSSGWRRRHLRSTAITLHRRRSG